LNVVQRYKDWAPSGFDPKGLALPDRQEWLVAPVVQNRDSGPRAQSNFSVVLEDLGGESETVEVHQFGHWGPGWFEIILCAPEHEEKLEGWEAALASYPVASDSDLSEREYAAAQEAWIAYGCDAFVAALVAAFELSEPTADFLSGAEHEDPLWRLHMDHAPYGYSSDEGTSFDFRYLETRDEPSRDMLAKAIRAMRKGAL
jgi:hypothetical protein